MFDEVEPAVAPDGAGRERRPLGTEPNTILPGEDDADGPREPVRELARGRRSDRRRLAPEGPTVGQRSGRDATRFAPRGVGLQVRRLDPARRQAHAAGRERRQAERRHDLDRRTPPLHLARELAGFPERLGDHPGPSDGLDRRRRSTGRRRDRDQRIAWGFVVGEPAVAQRNPGADLLRDTALELGASSGGGEIARPVHLRVRGRRDGIVDGVPARAPTEVRRERAVDLDSARIALREQRRRPHEDPGRAEPALRTSRGHERVGEAIAYRRGQALHRGHDTSLDPRDRRDARDPGGAVDQHRAAPALPLGRTAVLHRHDAEPFTQDREEGFTRRRVDRHVGAVARELHGFGRARSLTEPSTRHLTRHLETDLHRAG